MANECLVTKLKSAVNNDSLITLNQIPLKVHASENPTGITNCISIYRGATFDVGGDGYLMDIAPSSGHWSDGTNSIGKTKTTPYANTQFYFSNGDYVLKLSPKTGGQYNTFEAGSSVSVNIEDFQWRIDKLGLFKTLSSYSTGSLVKLLKKRTDTETAMQIDLRNTSCTFSLAGLLDNDIICKISKLYLQNTPYVTDKDSDTLAAIREKFTGIDLQV